MGLIAYFLMAMTLVLMATEVRSDLAKDRDLCADQLIGLAECLPYVGGEVNAPTLECCSGLKTLLIKGKICLCLLVKDRDDPQLGLKINASLALNLPSSCHAPANVSQCPGLLNLAPNSTEAKIFYEAGNKSSTNGSHTATPVSSSSSSSSEARKVTSDAGGGGGSTNKMIGNWVAIKMASTAFAWWLAAHIAFIIII